MKLENEDDLLWQDYIEIGDFSKALNVCNMYGLQHSKKSQDYLRMIALKKVIIITQLLITQVQMKSSKKLR
jgi:hypothetical protein